MKKYIPANIAIVRLHNNVIATSLVDGEDYETGDHTDEVGAPRRERRRYGVSYGESYEADYDLF